MSRYQLTRKARQDLDAIWEYIAADSIHAADRIVDALAETFERLASFPLMGRVRPDIANPPVRLFTSKGHTIIYRPDTRPIRILRVTGYGRDLLALRIDGDV